MNLQDFNQITTPNGWKEKALHLDQSLTRHSSVGKAILTVVVLVCVSCVTVLSANTVHRYYNETIIADDTAMQAEVAQEDLDHYGFSSPSGSSAILKEEMIASKLESKETWTTDTRIRASILPELANWTSMQVDTTEGPVWERHIYDANGNTKIEWISNTPLLLQKEQSEYASWNLTWLEGQYESLPYGNLSYTISGLDGQFLGCCFSAFYLCGEDAYLDLSYTYTAQHETLLDNLYILEDQYDRAEKFSTDSGISLVLLQKGNQTRIHTETPHFQFYGYAGNMDLDTVKEVVNHLDLHAELTPEICTKGL
ncbi:hypothetical protein [Evtepia sp.]